MNVSLYFSRTRRASQRRDIPLTESEGILQTPRLLQESSHGPRQLTEAGSTIGFWVIPQKSGTYLKLKILREYKSEFNLDTNWTVSGFRPNSPWPIQPLIQNRKLLLTYFQWIKHILPEDMRGQSMYRPDTDDYEAAAESLVESLFYHKWKYFVIKDGVAFFGSNRRKDPTLNLVLAEVLDGKEQKPTSVKVDGSGITKLHVINARGKVMDTYNPTQLQVLAKAKPVPVPEDDDEEEKSPAEITAEVRQLLDASKDDEALAFFITHVRDQDDLMSFRSEFLSRILSPNLVRKQLMKAFRKTPGDYEHKLSRIRGILLSFIAACKKNGDPHAPTVDDYDDAIGLRESKELLERSYYSLWNMTRSNGGYRRGGMRRVRGRWVYDPSVPGRSTNGARYVTTAPPRPMVDQDGRIVLRFQYQSRPNRNTTGMSQIGYIKFRDHEAFLKTASRNIGLAIAKRDVLVACTCPDFRYRWHWVLAQDGSAPDPMGVGNAPPDKTNPQRKLSMCKHLSAVSVFLLNRPSAAYDKAIRQVIKSVQKSPTKPASDKKDGNKEPEAEDDSKNGVDSPVVRPGAELGNPDSPTPEDT